MLTKLLVLGQQPAQTQEPKTNEITFLGPTLSTCGRGITLGDDLVAFVVDTDIQSM